MASGFVTYDADEHKSYTSKLTVVDKVTAGGRRHRHVLFQ